MASEGLAALNCNALIKEERSEAPKAPSSSERSAASDAASERAKYAKYASERASEACTKYWSHQVISTAIRPNSSAAPVGPVAR